MRSGPSGRDGFIAMAAATCVFNPNLGQGMSVAAADAGILKQCLKTTSALDKLPELFFSAPGQLSEKRLSIGVQQRP